MFYNIFFSFVVIIILLYIFTDCNTKFINTPVWPCPYNNRLKNIYIDKPDDKYTSLSLFDIYSFTHISHGMILFYVLYYFHNYSKSKDMIYYSLIYGRRT